MNAPEFLESLSNLPHADYMLSLRSRNPAYFLARARWLLKQIPPLAIFLSKTKIIHITGTSGKGTVGAILQSILAESGHTVGFYNSPHVETVYERVRISRTNRQNTVTTFSIPDDEFESIVSKLKPVLEKAVIKSPFGLPSYFDILFVIGLCYFNKINCDWIIIEVGCGGRYDSTNIIPDSVLSIITSIGYDHTQLIGPRLSQIAYEKSGIIKPRGRVVAGASIKGKILSIIRREAAKNRATFHLSLPAKNIKDDNAGTAKTAAKLLGIKDDAINRGIKRYVPLPGRFEIISEHPAVILDGAHNSDKIKYLARALNDSPIWIKSRRKFLIFAATGAKDWRAMLRVLVPYFDKIYLTRHTVRERKVADMKAMYRYAEKCNGHSPSLYLDPDDALKDALRNASPSDIIVATGSLYLLGSLKYSFQNLSKGFRRHRARLSGGGEEKKTF
ncbi:MAG: hypothetical protein HY564_01425 [Candidatus Jacksonbacteria bacterium]|nr:hypothetical protein [Candidatus Jacksonbacteria bacterium]